MHISNNSVQNNVKVSVILPIYNQEKYLKKAIESLQNQTLKETEFICVNDGSKDNSLNILKDYALKDERIKIIDQKNQGAGTARNNGLRIAKGEYVAFLDPDDWIESDALETLYTKSKKQNCDMVVFDFNKVNDQGDLLGRYNLKRKMQTVFGVKENENFNWRNLMPRVFGGIFTAAWNKFYKREFIKENDLHFAKCNLAEDNVFVFGATLSAKNIGYSDKPLYNYVIHDNSAIRSRSDKHFCLFKSLDSVKKLLKKLGLEDELKNEFDNYIVRIVSFHKKQIISVDRFLEVCKKRLSQSQNQRLNERYTANAKLLPMLNSIIAKKMKV